MSLRQNRVGHMNALGWILWGLGCLSLLSGLTGLGRPKGRIKRIIFCTITATALALSYFTPFSKFHLLWVIPLRYLAGLLGFGLLAGGALTYHKLTERTPEKRILPANSFPPFGELKWDSGDWEGQIRLPAWAGFQSRGGPYGSQDSERAADGSAKVMIKPPGDAEKLEPTADQCRALEFQIQHGEEVVEAVLEALLPKYREWKNDWQLDDELMPPVSSAPDFRKMMGLSIVHVRPQAADGLAYVGLEIGCDWEEEHGLGVVVHGKRVVDIGDASTAFEWTPDEQGEQKSPAGEGK
jgi:hypothetical protein